MTEFKVGDKVRVFDTTKHGEFGISEVFPFETVVTDVYGYDSIQVRGSDGTYSAWYVMPEMLELIEDETKFKVGDKVRVADSESWASGQAGVVSTSDYALPFEVTVVLDGDSEKYFFKPALLELVEDEPEVQVGDKVRVTETYTREFVVYCIDSDDGSIRGKDFGESFYADNPAYTLEVIEKAKPKFEVGQVLTEVEELEALPVGAVVIREWLGTKTPPRTWTKTEAGEFHAPGMDWDRTAKVFGHHYGLKKITVVWLP